MTLVRRNLHHKKTSKLAQRRKKIFLLKVIGACVIITSLVAGVIVALRTESLNIVNISIKGNSPIADKVLRAFVEEKLSGKYMFFLPKSSSILYSRKDIEAAIIESFKEIKEVKISFEDLKTISINIEGRKPFALYCGEKKIKNSNLETDVSGEVEDHEQSNKTSDSGCYFLDDEGFIFSHAPDFSGNAYLIYYRRIEDGGPIGKQFVSPQEFKEISFFMSSLIDIGLKPVVFNMSEENVIEIELKNGGLIIFNEKQSLSDIFDNVQSVFSSDEFNVNNLPSLEYADFRFGNKVYFKFK